MKKVYICSIFFIASIFCLYTLCSNKTKYVLYNQILSFSEGLATVKLDGKYGFINTKGKEVIPCKYDYAGEFSEGLAKVGLDGKDGYINTKGKLVIATGTKEHWEKEN